MYKLVGGRNRLLLFLIGLILLCSGLAAGLLASPWRPGGITLPAADAQLPDLAAAPDLVWLPIVVGVAGLLIALIGLSWFIAQVPRRDDAKALRLHQDPTRGTTSLPSAVIRRAVEAQLDAMPGVTDSRALLRGTARAPELTIRVTADDRTDIADLVSQIRGRIAPDLAASLETALAHLAVRVDDGGTRQSTQRTVL
ncbi:MAG: alkaline shock response membrane anchor protein AmaP [Propionibacteriales bacterium]|nr:alkaline shock response membrane anchor protein AmaP [Propionibacteriales bacterium]